MAEYATPIPICQLALGKGAPRAQVRRVVRGPAARGQQLVFDKQTEAGNMPLHCGRRARPPHDGAAWVAEPVRRGGLQAMVVVHLDDAPAVTTETGTRLKVLLDTATDGQGRLSLAMETLGPGQRNARHWHAELEETYFILTGHGVMEIGAESQHVRAGETVLIPRDQVHCLRNAGDGNLCLLCPGSPPWHAADYHVVEEAHG